MRMQQKIGEAKSGLIETETGRGHRELESRIGTPFGSE